ncbi:hypothetical protein CDAR_242231 [Caerostris darwini]|uniref:Beta-fibrinogen n=1 Tax=Caerostris darwini TaxID=1538125 RepID=A0AAV4NQ64_9ARAC|nr:hypothetical protein CDAR_242231 [Caerostris darwini]
MSFTIGFEDMSEGWGTCKMPLLGVDGGFQNYDSATEDMTFVAHRTARGPASPLQLVERNDDTWGPCGDYRSLNAIK